MGIGGVAQLRTRDADFAEETEHFVASRRSVETLVAADRLAYLLSGGEERIEKGHRVLEDHRNAASAQVFHFSLGQGRQIEVMKENATGDELSRWHGHQLHDRSRSHTL